MPSFRSVTFLILFGFGAAVLTFGAPAPPLALNLEEIVDLLAATQEPLTVEQVAALTPIMESVPLEAAQAGTILSDELRDQIVEILTESQNNALLRAEAGQMLLAEGVEGLKATLESADVPALTFDQETQIQSVYEDHVRALNELLETNGGDRSAVERQIRELEDQVLLAALKFLNPVQRAALAGSMTAAGFAALNSDLPEDEDELREYLNDLRSPAGGGGNSSGGGGNRSGGSGNWSGGGGGNRSGGSGNWSGGGGGGGGGLSINGFGNGGRLPNRDEIQEIRINENSFTAEQPSQGRGQTQIITRGGTGGFNGDATFNFADESLDARNALTSSRPFYQQRDLRANVSGPLIRNRLTMTFGYQRNESENAANLFATTPDGIVNDALTQPGSSRSYNLNSTAQLAQNHVLNFSYSKGNQGNELNNVGNQNLAEQGSRRAVNNWNIQVKETAILSSRVNHEVRFNLTRFIQENHPLTPGEFNINVRGAFRGGGSTNDSINRIRNYTFGNLLMYTGDTVSLRVGYDGTYRDQNSVSRSNYNGTYTFASLYDYCGVVLGGFPTQQCIIEQQGALADKAQFEQENPGEVLDITPGILTFTQSGGDPSLPIKQLQSAVFFQSDWRVRPDLTLSFGARYEWQDRLDDYNNLDPRFGFAYALGTNTVLRGGTGIFHQRFDTSAASNLIRFDGTRQTRTIVINPSWEDRFLDGGQGNPLSEIRSAAEDLVAPYTWHSEVSLETSFANGFTLTGSYAFVRSIHQYRSRNLNAPLDLDALALGVIQSCQADQDEFSCGRPDPTQGNINLLESTGVGSDHRVRVGFRQRLSFLNINGSYTFSSNYQDSPGAFDLPSDNYDLDSEWARSGERNRLNMSANFRMPWNVNADTIFNWNTGQPYTLETGRDDNQDTSTNDRPSGVPRGSLTGPGLFRADVRLSKAIQLRSEEVFIEGTTGPAASGGYYGQRTGLRMTIRADINNVLNKTNFQSFSGVQTSPRFGLPTRARDARSVALSVRFDF